MNSTALFDQVVAAYLVGDEATLEHLAQEHVPVNTVLFLASMGGGRVYDDVGLIERVAHGPSF
jgi:hypothetical protein